mgnify:CR=1 FL=1
MPRVALLGQVIVSGEPKAEIQLFVQLLKEIGQPVLGIIPLFEQLLLHFCGKAVADYHINIPVHMLQCLSGMPQLRFGGEFFRLRYSLSRLSAPPMVKMRRFSS